MQYILHEYRKILNKYCNNLSGHLKQLERVIGKSVCSALNLKLQHVRVWKLCGNCDAAFGKFLCQAEFSCCCCCCSFPCLLLLLCRTSAQNGFENKFADLIKS